MTAAHLAPAPSSWLDCAADCIDIGDEIGRLLFLRLHAAGITFEASAAPSFVTRIGQTSRQFAAKFAGICAVSGRKVWPGDLVSKIDGGGIVLAQVIREWDFRSQEGGTGRSEFVRPEMVTVEAVTAALRAGALVTTMNREFQTLTYKMVGETVKPCSVTGGDIWGSKGRTYKTVDAWWTVTASKSQALRVRA